MITQYGIDTLRVWAVKNDTDRDILLSGLNSTEMSVKLIRSLLLTLVNKIRDFDGNLIEVDSMSVLDRLVMWKLEEF